MRNGLEKRFPDVSKTWNNRRDEIQEMKRTTMNDGKVLLEAEIEENREKVGKALRSAIIEQFIKRNPYVPS